MRRLRGGERGPREQRRPTTTPRMRVPGPASPAKIQATDPSRLPPPTEPGGLPRLFRRTPAAPCYAPLRYRPGGRLRDGARRVRERGRPCVHRRRVRPTPRHLAGVEAGHRLQADRGTVPEQARRSRRLGRRAPRHDAKISESATRLRTMAEAFCQPGTALSDPAPSTTPAGPTSRATPDTSSWAERGSTRSARNAPERGRTPKVTAPRKPSPVATSPSGTTTARRRPAARTPIS